jgi:hypothetical protein
MNREKSEKKKEFAIDFEKSLISKHIFQTPCFNGVSDR